MLQRLYSVVLDAKVEKFQQQMSHWGQTYTLCVVLLNNIGWQSARLQIQGSGVRLCCCSEVPEIQRRIASCAG